MARFGLPGNNNNNNNNNNQLTRMTRYFGAFNQCCLFSLIFFLTFNFFPPISFISLLWLSPSSSQAFRASSRSRIPLSHPPSYILTNVLVLMSLFVPIGPPHCCEPHISPWPHLQASLSPPKILAPEKPLLLSSEKLDHDHYPAREESLKLNQFRSAPDSWPSLPITNEGVLS